VYRKPDWSIEGRDWPHRETSRFVDAGALRWHVQIMGEGPPLLLLHGTGAATHSWRGLAPLLAQQYSVIAPDLPGHGFTATPANAGLTLPGMARLVGDLMRTLDIPPAAIVGHSAGAAIALRMALDARAAPHAVVGVNAALKPFAGVAARLMPVAARLLLLNPVSIQLMARRGSDASRVARLMRSTGSRLEEAGVEFYRRLFGCTGHVAAVLGMMAHWDLAPLQRDLPALKAGLTLIVGDNDLAVPPGDAALVAPAADVVRLPSLGHLAHEEAPQALADAILLALRRPG
jgi:magnesium chelatase accessory protein